MILVCTWIRWSTVRGICGVCAIARTARGGGDDKSENRLIRGYEELKFHYNRGIIEISFPLKIFLKYNS